VPRPLKVFGYTGHRQASYGPKNVHGQTAEIIAAATKAEVYRKAGISRPQVDRTLHEAGNPVEVAQAMTSPGTVFWQPHNNMARTGEWTAVPPQAES